MKSRWRRWRKNRQLKKAPIRKGRDWGFWDDISDVVGDLLDDVVTKIFKDLF